MQLRRDPSGDAVEVETQDSAAGLVDRWKIEEVGGAGRMHGGERTRGWKGIRERFGLGQAKRWTLSGGRPVFVVKRTLECVDVELWVVRMLPTWWIRNILRDEEYSYCAACGCFCGVGNR